MIAFADTAPDVSVNEAEFVRLLGFPRGHVLEGRALELAQWAREWYSDHGQPWVYARQSSRLRIGPGVVELDDVPFRSERLSQTLEQAEARSAVIGAVSAGPEIERQAHDAWIHERPDEYFFLEMFGSAVVEHLTTMTGARLCAWADTAGQAVLPHYSPGYPEWDISDQERLFSLIGADALPGSLEVLDSGMLRPKKSLLAVFGVTPHIDRVRRLGDLVPCENCSFAACEYRRVPYGRAPAKSAPAAVDAVYGTSAKALKRWAAERLSISRGVDGHVDALFRYDGTTCTNMGRPLAFDYRVRLGPRHAGYPIEAQTCTPARGDEGHRAMCEYVRRGAGLIHDIASDAPLLGRPLEAVLAWKRPAAGPGCYCESDARAHKWGLVLETIHYALSEDDRTRL